MILAHAQLQEARLLVISQDYGRTGFLRSWPVAQSVARHSPAPVLVVPTERPAGGDASGDFIEILCAIDFSVASAIAMRQAVLGVAEEIGADLIVMGVAPRGLLDRALSGSVSRAVASRTHVPLLFVPVVAGIYEWREQSRTVVMHRDVIDPMLAGLAQSRGSRL